jgi:hypothetical protein
MSKQPLAVEASMAFEAGYGSVEAALVEAYHIPDKARGAFRGRLAALQKGGLLGPKNMPGKGIALRYGPDQLHRMLFACELLEFGIAPSVVLSVVKMQWESRLQRIFRIAEDAAKHDLGPDDVILHLGGVHLMVDRWSDAVPNVNSCPLRKLPDHVATWMSMTPEDRLPPRAIVTNLSMRLRAFHAAFAKSYLDEVLAERASAQEARTGGRRRHK